MTNGNTISLADGFLAQILLETDVEIMANPRYASGDDLFNASVFYLAEAFRVIMGDMARRPGYGVAGALPEEALSSLQDVKYATLAPEVKEEVDRDGATLHDALKDPATRQIISAILVVRRAIEEQIEGTTGEEETQDA